MKKGEKMISFSVYNLVHYINEIRQGYFTDWSEDDAVNGRFENGMAVLETEYSDIEVNVYSESADDGSCYLNKVCVSYFICLRGSDKDDWEEFGYPEDLSNGYEVNVDFATDNWQELLKTDMEQKLFKFLKEFQCHSDNPNWHDKREFATLYARIAGI